MNILNRLKSENHASLLKYMLMGAIGFGIGSFFPFNLYADMSYAYPNLTEMLIFGAIGGVSLGIISRNIKKIVLAQ